GHPPVRVPEVAPQGGILRSQAGRLFEHGNGVAVATGKVVAGARVGVPLAGRGDLHRATEYFGGRVEIATEEQRGAEVAEQRGIAGRELDATPVLRDGGCPAALLEEEPAVGIVDAPVTFTLVDGLLVRVVGAVRIALGCERRA